MFGVCFNMGDIRVFCVLMGRILINDAAGQDRGK